VGLTFLVEQPVPEVVQAFRAAVDLKADPHLSASVPIRGPGTTADFASLVLEPGGAAEANRYLDAGPGDTLNLSADAALTGSERAGIGARLQSESSKTMILCAALDCAPNCRAGLRCIIARVGWIRLSASGGRISPTRR